MTRAKNGRYSHVVDFDDMPFAADHRGDVGVVGAVYCDDRLEGVLHGRVRRDGVNATRVLAGLLEGSRWAPQLQAVLLQGIAMAGFNVVDLAALHRRLALPVVAVARRAPDLAAIELALRTRVPGGSRKWRLIRHAGPMRAAAGLYLQPVGLSLDEAAALVRRHARHGRVPEPLRTAHLIAAGMSPLPSRQRV